MLALLMRCHKATSSFYSENNSCPPLPEPDPLLHQTHVWGYVITIGVCICYLKSSDLHSAVADPGFPRGGGANSPGGRQHTNLSIFPKNCMKLKEFGPPGGGARPLRPPLDPPLFCVPNQWRIQDFPRVGTPTL